MAARKSPSNPPTGPTSTSSKLEIGFWHMLRDVLIAALNKGQLLPALMGIILMIVAYRLPPADLGALMREILEKLQNSGFLGWALFVIVSGTWCVVSLRTRKKHRAELRRIGLEKSELQKRLLGLDAPSTRD